MLTCMPWGFISPRDTSVNLDLFQCRFKPSRSARIRLRAYALISSCSRLKAAFCTGDVLDVLDCPFCLLVFHSAFTSSVFEMLFVDRRKKWLVCMWSIITLVVQGLNAKESQFGRFVHCFPRLLQVIMGVDSAVVLVGLAVHSGAVYIRHRALQANEQSVDLRSEKCGSIHRYRLCSDYRACIHLAPVGASKSNQWSIRFGPEYYPGPLETPASSEIPITAPANAIDLRARYGDMTAVTVVGSRCVPWSLVSSLPTCFAFSTIQLQSPPAQIRPKSHMNYHQFEPKLKDIPKIPDEFGEDGGNFYRYYDALADELDEDMVKSLKAQLDGILIFVS